MQSHRNEFSERNYLWNDLPMMMMLLDWDLCPYRVDQSFQALRTVNQLESDILVQAAHGRKDVLNRSA